jgi:diguanylate cyclase (GGDEF)-like protein
MGPEKTYTLLFRALYSCLLVAVLFCVSMIVLDPQKTVQLYPDPGAAAHLFSDSEDSPGTSVAAWINREETLYQCDIGYGAPYPYCGLVIKYKDAKSPNYNELDLFEFGDAAVLDLSSYDGIKISVDYQGESNSLSFSIRNATVLPNNQAEYDVIPFAYTNFDSRKKQDFIDFSRMEVAKWWIDRYNPPQELRKPAFNGVFEISISMPELPVAGNHKIKLISITAAKSYFSQKNLLLTTYGFIGAGFLALIIQALLGYFSRRYAKENQTLRTTMNIDPLTKCLNRLGLERATSGVFPLAESANVYVMVLDLDHFKRINDTLGHATGDEVLRKASQAIAKELRSDDVLSRWGGEEFVVVSRISPDHLESLVNRLMRSLDDIQIEGTSEPYIISMSVGVTKAQVGEAFDDIFRRADEAMYQVKQAGRRNWKLI